MRRSSSTRALLKLMLDDKEHVLRAGDTVIMPAGTIISDQHAARSGPRHRVANIGKKGPLFVHGADHRRRKRDSGVPHRIQEGRVLALAYGVASYLAFLAAFLYAVGFVGNLLVPKSIDSGPTGSLPAAALIDTLLLLLFAVPHSVMARPAFKRWWTRFVPPPVERSTYVLVSSLALGLLFWQWRPMPGLVWDVTNPAGRWLLLAVFWLGWALVLLSTFLIDHFDLFGLEAGLPLRLGASVHAVGVQSPPASIAMSATPSCSGFSSPSGRPRR